MDLFLTGASHVSTKAGSIVNVIFVVYCVFVRSFCYQNGSM